MQTRLDNYGPSGYAWLVLWDATWSEAESNFAGTDPTNYFEDIGGSVFLQYANAFEGGYTGIPQHGLVDKDGNVRKYGVGATDRDPWKTEWDNAIEDLLGIGS